MRIAFMICIFLLSLGAHSQDRVIEPHPTGTPILRAGVFAQGSRPSLLANFIDHPGMRGGGLNGGAFMRWTIGKDFFVRPEVNLRAAGLSGEFAHCLVSPDSIPYLERETATRFNEFVLETPVLIEYQVEPKVIGYGGLHLAYLLHQQTTYIDEARLFEGLQGFERVEKSSSLIERLEIGFTMGVIAQIKYNTWIDVRLSRFVAEAGNLLDRYEFSRGGLTFGASLCFALE